MNEHFTIISFVRVKMLNNLIKATFYKIILKNVKLEIIENPSKRNSKHF